MSRHSICALALLSLAFTSFASLPALGKQSATSGAVTQTPQDVRLQVQIDGGKTQFQTGEIVPLKLSFTSSAAKKYQINMATYDRSGRMNYEKFLIEPESGWSDPLQTYFRNGASMMGGLTTFDFLSLKPTVIQLDLNELVRFDRPGKYRLRIVSHRVGELPEDNSYPKTNTELISNELRLTIIPASKPWQEATLKSAVAALDRFGSPSSETTPAVNQTEAAQKALKTLRYLGTAEAARELARRLRGEDARADYQCMFGLVGSPHTDTALGEMRRLLSAPDHPVSSTFLYALTVLMRSQDQPLERLMEEDRRNRESIKSELLEAVSRKRGKALALTLNTILETVSYEDGKPKPVSPQLAAQIAAIFEQLPVEKQRGILEFRWELIKSPVFLPVLRKVARQYREFTVPNEENAYNSLHLSGAALQHWYELEPAEARLVIIGEITRPRPRYTARVLGVLPDETLPEVEQALAKHFVAEQDSYAAENLASLLHRYATNAVLQQIVPVVDKRVGKWACAIQAPILAYLLRVNPEVARPRIEAAMAARGEGYSACNHSLLIELGALQQDSSLEEIAIHSLDDDDPQVAGNAATFLGKYGSDAAEEKLWERLIRWNEEWQGREKEFRYVPSENNPNMWQGGLGTNLIHALATGKSWLTDEGKLQRLRGLALGRDMQQEVDSRLAGWAKKPWTISHYRSGKQQHFQVLQYETNSLEGIEEKLAQFPSGSNFTWAGGGGETVSEDEKRTFNELSEFLAKCGMKLSDPAN